MRSGRSALDCVLVLPRMCRQTISAAASWQASVARKAQGETVGEIRSSLAASFLVGALLGGGLIFGALNDQGREAVANEVVSADIRALMAPQPFDVASSDRHTVKPWFAGKLAFAPNVVDLSAKGFPLVGARIDVIGLEPAASLVYSKGKHLITVMEMPNPRGLTVPVSQDVEQGYQVLTWSDRKVTYWAVSDAAADESGPSSVCSKRQCHKLMPTAVWFVRDPCRARHVRSGSLADMSRACADVCSWGDCRRSEPLQPIIPRERLDLRLSASTLDFWRRMMTLPGFRLPAESEPSGQ